MSFPQIQALEEACQRVRAEDRVSNLTMTAMAIASVMSREGQKEARKYSNALAKIAGFQGDDE